MCEDFRQPSMSALEMTADTNSLSPRLWRMVPWLLVLLAAIFRLWALDLKPPHFDEGINGWFVDRITENGSYQYDPTNYHGPLHFYVLFVFQTLLGRNIWALRLPVVFVGVATVLLAWQFRRYLGERAAALAALAMAIGPGFVFYQRYSIHESWLVFFLMLAAWGCLGLCQKGDRFSLWMLLLGGTGTVLTKETYIIHVAAAALAFLLVQGLEGVSPARRPLVVAEQVWSSADLAKGLAVSLFALLFFYSGNFFHWESLPGMLTTFEAWAKTGLAHSGHEKELYQWGPLNYFWLALCWRYEPFALLGGIAAIAALGPVDWKVRWLALYAAGCLTVYSLIPYKTPWCNISIVWPFYLLAGRLLDEALKSRAAVFAGALFFAAATYSLRQDWNLNLRHYDDDREPYVYVQTFRDVNEALRPVFALVQREPGRTDIRASFYLGSYYPLPWVLGAFDKINYYKPKQIEQAADADWLLCEKQDGARLEKTLRESYYRVPFRLRSGMPDCVAYYNQKMFSQEFHGQPLSIRQKPDPEKPDPESGGTMKATKIL